MIESIDPNLIALALTAIIGLLVWKGPKTFITISPYGNFIWILICVFFALRFYLLREFTTFSISNATLAIVFAMAALLFALSPGLANKILKGG